LTVAQEKTADAYALCMIATKSRMDTVDRFECVRDSLRGEGMWREPTACAGKQTSNSTDHNTNRYEAAH
jgi:hypothetical protein